MKRSIVLSVTAAGALLTVSQIVLGAAQSNPIPDNKENHWAYVAIRDLANKHLVRGYKDAKPLEDRELTAFEFATLIDRTLTTLDDMKAAKDGKAVDKDTPSPKSIDNATLNEVQALALKFQDELASIKADVKKAQEDIDALRSDVEDAKEFANKAKQTADNSYGAGSGRKFSLSGYIQTRFNSVSSRDGVRYPTGTTASSSGYNGNYMQGGAPESFVVRRSRLKAQGQISANTKYTIQLDAGGLTSGTNQAVTVREGNIAYTSGDGSSMNPTFTIGLFANPFGYMLPTSSASIIPSERPLAFSENGEGIWNGQDYDRGVQLSYGPQQIKYTLAFVNGSGRGSNDTDGRIDMIGRVAYQSMDKTWGVGASVYNGRVSYAAAPAPTRKKELFGVDMQYTSPKGPFIQAEYLGGKFEQISYFDDPTLKMATLNAPGNKINGYYVTVGTNLNMTGPHPVTVAASYDKLRRSSSGNADSGSNFDDVNFGGGILYGLDSATRLRLWYISPSKVAHPSLNPAPHKTGLFTMELQVKF